MRGVDAQQGPDQAIGSTAKSRDTQDKGRAETGMQQRHLESVSYRPAANMLVGQCPIALSAHSRAG